MFLVMFLCSIIYKGISKSNIDDLMVIGYLIGGISTIISAIQNYKLSIAFDKGVWFSIGMVLFSPVFIIILGFGDAEYKGIP